MFLRIITYVIIIYCILKILHQLSTPFLKKVGTYTFMCIGVSIIDELLNHKPGYVTMKTANNYLGEYKHTERMKCFTKAEAAKLRNRKTKTYDVYALPAFKKCYAVCDKGTLPEMSILQISIYTMSIMMLVVLLNM